MASPWYQSCLFDSGTDVPDFHLSDNCRSGFRAINGFLNPAESQFSRRLPLVILCAMSDCWRCIEACQLRIQVSALSYCRNFMYPVLLDAFHRVEFLQYRRWTIEASVFRLRVFMLPILYRRIFSSMGDNKGSRAITASIHLNIIHRDRRFSSTSRETKFKESFDATRNSRLQLLFASRTHNVPVPVHVKLQHERTRDRIIVAYFNSQLLMSRGCINVVVSNWPSCRECCHAQSKRLSPR